MMCTVSSRCCAYRNSPDDFGFLIFSMAEYLRLAPVKLEFLISESLRNKTFYIFWVTSFYGVLSRNFLGSTLKLIYYPESS